MVARGGVAVGKVTVVRRTTIRGTQIALFTLDACWFVAVLRNGIVYCERYASLAIAYREWYKGVLELAGC